MSRSKPNCNEVIGNTCSHRWSQLKQINGWTIKRTLIEQRFPTVLVVPPGMVNKLLMAKGHESLKASANRLTIRKALITISQVSGTGRLIWRRRKQERARQCHYRRYAQRSRPSKQLPLATQANHTTYPANLSDQ